MSLELFNITDNIDNWDLHWSSFTNSYEIYIKEECYGISNEDLSVIGS